MLRRLQQFNTELTPIAEGDNRTSLPSRQGSSNRVIPRRIRLFGLRIRVNCERRSALRAHGWLTVCGLRGECGLVHDDILTQWTADCQEISSTRLRHVPVTPRFRWCMIVQIDDKWFQPCETIFIATTHRLTQIVL